MPTTSAPARPSLGDILRRERFLTALSLYLEDVPGRDRRAIYTDLRADLADAAQAHGMRAAIADLGPAAALAQDYRDAQGRKLPRWWVGGLVAGAMALLGVFSLLAYTAGLLDAVASIPGATTAQGSFFWTQVSVENTPDALAASFEGAGPLIGIALFFTVYFLVARGWRLWTRSA